MVSKVASAGVRIATAPPALALLVIVLLAGGFLVTQRAQPSDPRPAFGSGADAFDRYPWVLEADIPLPEPLGGAVAISAGEATALTGLDPEGVVVAARANHPGFVGTSPIVRFLLIEGEPTWVVVSDDVVVPIAGPRGLDVSELQIAVEYGWVFVGVDGSDRGAASMAYGEGQRAPALPSR